MQKLLKNKKGYTVQDLAPLAIMVVVTAIVLGVGGDILTTIQASQTSGTAAHNASGGGLTAINTMASWQNTIALVLVAAVVIGVLFTAFYIKGRS